MTRPYHVPALAAEVTEWLNPQPGQTFVDATAGGGGHARLLAQRLAPGGTLALIDRDPEALAAAGAALEGTDVRTIAIHGNFREITALLRQRSIERVEGALFDLGVSSHQLDEPGRGFSFRADAPLDMRMDPTQGETAAQLLERMDERAIAKALYEYGEERWAARIARFIVEERRTKPLKTTLQLAHLVQRAIPKAAQPSDIHAATKVFQALRILVNDELGALKEALSQTISLLAPGGRIAVIAYHSLEDRIVKETFLRQAGRCECPPGLPVCVCGARSVIRILTRKPVIPDTAETARNPRSRSARLRVAEKLHD
jgi:16S rRNA (cytosine1402-N4)-methyltransferase